MNTDELAKAVMPRLVAAGWTLSGQAVAAVLEALYAELRAQPDEPMHRKAACEHRNTTPGADYNEWCDDCGGMLPRSTLAQ